MSSWFHTHAHSAYSKLDGMTTVKRMVKKAALLGQPALALTDHGTGAGWVQLYNESKTAGILPFPGVEAYLLDPQASLADKKAGRYHLGLIAIDYRGYKALVRAMNLSYTRPRFNRFPRLTLEDLVELGSEHGYHLVLTTGCFFGYVQQMLMEGDEQAAEGVVKVYAQSFPNTFVEVQNHNIIHGVNSSGLVTDDNIVDALVGIADRLGLPILAAQDAHYVDQSEKPSHSLMKRMVFGGADDEFPGDSFHLASTEWVAEHYDAKTWGKALEGSQAVLDMHALSLPALDGYRAHVPGLGLHNPQRTLERRCTANLDALGMATDKYTDKLAYELSVIGQLGMANYFLLVASTVKWCRDEHICVEARGSANGSLVAYLLGITQVDPLKWKLPYAFDRFLAIDRVQPPDIDIDVEDVRRGDILGYLATKYETVQIGTHALLGLRDIDGQGSVIVTYKSMLARQAKEAGETFRFGWLQNIDQVKKINPDDWINLQRINRMQSVRKSYGVHAGGVLIAGDDQKLDDYIPRMLVASSNTTVSQFDQDDVEKLGYLKLDVLGQSSLAAMRLCQEFIGRDDPTDFQWIPFDDPEACKLLREGRVDTGIFHVEAPAKSKGGREVGIKNTMDMVLVQALYMPGCMDVAPGMKISQKDLYIQRRNNPRLRPTSYVHPVFEKALKETYGAVVFQDQVVAIVRGLGMSVTAVNKFLKVVKDSGKGSHERNIERVREVRKEFDRACRAAKLDPDYVWQQTSSFVSYGFNRAHATGYGIRSYRTAYFKAHYPLEYMAALLVTWAGRDKERIYAREARRIGIRILPPDVNISGEVWSIDSTASRPTIRKGLRSIPRIGSAAAVEIARNAPYESIDDLIERTDSRAVTGGKNWHGDTDDLTGVLKALYEASALDSIL